MKKRSDEDRGAFLAQKGSPLTLRQRAAQIGLQFVSDRAIIPCELSHALNTAGDASSEIVSTGTEEP